MTTTRPLPPVGDDPQRLVRLDAVHNFRDMGGYPTVDGRTTRWGTLFRADGLYRLTDADLEVVRALGLRTVIDLRTPRELDERGTFPHHRHPVDFHHVSVITRTWNHDEAERYDDAADFLEYAYLSMLDDVPEQFGRAFELLAAPDALPAVFHCAAGKDRTGLLAMMVLGSIGVLDEYIVADYAMTEEGMERMRAWARREYPEMYENMNSSPSVFSAAVPEAMRRMLGHVRERHGSVRGLVNALGVDDSVIDRLTASLLVS